MIFKKDIDGGLEHVSIESIEGLNSVMKQLNKSTKSNTVDSKSNKSSTIHKKNTTIRLNKSQFICTYLTDDTLIDFLMETDHNFIIHYSTGKQIEIELVDIYRKAECACIYCKKLVINDDPDILDKMDDKSYIEITLDNTILQIIAEKQFRILEIMTDNIAQIPSSISSYPTFLPPIVTLPQIVTLPPIVNVDINNVDISILGIKICNFIDLSI